MAADRGRGPAAWSLQLDEELIVRRAAAGDLDAFRLVYERNIDIVIGFLRNRVGSQRAEDLAAETFVRAFERISGFEWRGIPVRAWLLRIAYNLVVADARKKTDHTTLSDHGDLSIAGHEDVVAAHLSDSPVRRSLAALPRAQQEVLHLRFVNELSVGETAVVIGSTEEAVRAMTYRALKALRRDLDEAVT